jgi:hypothetical protein
MIKLICCKEWREVPESKGTAVIRSIIITAEFVVIARPRTSRY